ncbi:MAG: preprotein translocase subunit YajC [Ruminococcaceae bacterium]|nr:preprotein translocase subunit YajC [Oscillospiraceae bacterium]
MLSSLALPILLLVALYFIMIRPQKKKEKETAKMRNELQIGDEVTTIGGIIGRVVQIKDQDQIVLETGADKNKIRIKRWAIQEKNTISD